MREGASQRKPGSATGRRRGLRDYMRDGWALGGAALRLAVRRRDLRRFVVPAYGAVILLEVLLGAGVIAARHDGTILERVVAGIVLTYIGALLTNLAAVGLAGLSDRVLDDLPVDPRDGWRLMVLRLPQVAGWAAVVVAVGIPARILTSWGVDQIAALTLGFGWTVMSFFAVPAIALEGNGPIRAALRSVRLVGRRWGEQLVGMVYVWLRPVIFIGLPGFAALVAGFVLLRSGFDLLGWTIATGGVIAIAIAYLLIVAGDSILSVALFRFAQDHTVPVAFDEAELERVLRSPAPLVLRTLSRLQGERIRKLRERLLGTSDGGE